MEVLGKKPYNFGSTFKRANAVNLIVKSIKFEILFLKCIQKCSPIEETVLTV